MSETAHHQTPPASGRWVHGDDPSLWRELAGEAVAVLGYGNQGRAQALNLRDAGREHGFEVRVGVRPGGMGETRARGDGFGPVALRELAGPCRVFVSLLPDEVQAEILSREIFEATWGARTLEPPGHRLLCLAHGFALVSGGLCPPPGWDVVLVAPAGPGHRLREEYVAGRGLPGLVAVHEDASGRALRRALALAQSVGLLRRGVYVTSVEHETIVDLFGEQAVLCGGMVALAEAAFDTLVERGYPAELAYMECIEQVAATAGLLSRFGPDGMRDRISPTALYGELTRGPRIVNDQVRRTLAEILDEVASGRFGREWMEDVRRGRARLTRLRARARGHAANAVHTRLSRWRGESQG